MSFVKDRVLEIAEIAESLDSRFEMDWGIDQLIDWLEMNPRKILGEDPEDIASEFVARWVRRRKFAKSPYKELSDPNLMAGRVVTQYRLDEGSQMPIPRDNYGKPVEVEGRGMMKIPGYEWHDQSPEFHKLAGDRSCESEHSWAWISPSGDFIPVDDHSEYALTKASVEGILKVLPEKVFSVPPHKALVWGEYALNHYRQTGGYPEDPPGLLTGYVWSIPADVQRLAEKKRLPTLSKGSWGLKQPLTRQEEAFLSVLGVFPEKTKITPDNAYNRKLHRSWDQSIGEILRGINSAAKSSLLNDGWVGVGNSYSLYHQGGVSPVQFESFFREVLECWKKKGIRPDPLKERLILTTDTTHRTISYDEALSRNASRRLQDEFFEYFLEGKRNTPTFEERFETWRDRDWNALRDDPYSEEELEASRKRVERQGIPYREKPKEKKAPTEPGPPQKVQRYPDRSSRPRRASRLRGILTSEGLT